jgi:hypothetical protein
MPKRKTQKGEQCWNHLPGDDRRDPVQQLVQFRVDGLVRHAVSQALNYACGRFSTDTPLAA